MKNKKLFFVKFTLILIVLASLIASIYGIYNVLHPPLTDCGRDQPSVLDAVFIAASVIPITLLSILLIKRRPHKLIWTILTIVLVILLFLLALIVPFGFVFKVNFCIPF